MKLKQFVDACKVDLNKLHIKAIDQYGYPVMGMQSYSWNAFEELYFDKTLIDFDIEVLKNEEVLLIISIDLQS